jgi:hypothetical protein
MEQERSLTCSQQPATDHYSQPDKSNPQHFQLFSYKDLKIFESQQPYKSLSQYLFKTVSLHTYFIFRY